LTNHYDPNQPRVPAGHHDGGQWTGGSPWDPSSAERHDPERTGLLKAILGPENDGDRSATLEQLISSPALGGPLGASGLERLIGDASVYHAFAPDPRIAALVAAVEAGLALFTWLSARNSRDRQAIIEFKAHGYKYDREDASGSQFELRGVRLLTKEEVGKVCEELKTVQRLTDEAVLNTLGERSEMSRTQYGTAIHTYVSRAIGDKNPNFKAEESFLKLQEEKKQNGDAPSAKSVDYGTKNSIRIDVFEKRDEKTVCIYDIKTGLSGLSPARRASLLAHVHGAYPGVTHIVIAEVRPTDQWRPR
jgi:hypothetical protein